MQVPRKVVIGVMGPSDCDEEIYALAREVGRLLAERGVQVLCGGRGGVMEAVARGAKEGGGLTIGVLGGADARESPPNAFIEVAIFTGMGDARNWINVCTSDAVIAIAGGYGTLSEIGLALKLGRPVVLLRSWRLEGNPPVPAIPTAETAAGAVEIALGAAGRSSKQ